MILVTLGTHPQPMDALLRTLDELAATRRILGPVIVQAARFYYRPAHLDTVSVVPYGRLLAWTSQADVVITHGGPGSIMMALACGKRPLVVPRDPDRGEHVDGHQLRFVEWLASRRPIVPVTDLADLGIRILEALEGPAMSQGERGEAAPSAAAIARLRSVLAS